MEKLDNLCKILLFWSLNEIMLIKLLAQYLIYAQYCYLHLLIDESYLNSVYNCKNMMVRTCYFSAKFGLKIVVKMFCLSLRRLIIIFPILTMNLNMYTE
jgi:hypothetical protein